MELFKRLVQTVAFNNTKEITHKTKGINYRDIKTRTTVSQKEMATIEGFYRQDHT